MSSRSEGFFEREAVESGWSAAPPLGVTDREFGQHVAEYRRYLWANRFAPPPGSAHDGISSEGATELVPTGGWFTDEGWRRMRGGYRYDSR